MRTSALCARRSRSASLCCCLRCPVRAACGSPRIGKPGGKSTPRVRKLSEPGEIFFFSLRKKFIFSLDMYISNLETYIFRLDFYISKLEI